MTAYTNLLLLSLAISVNAADETVEPGGVSMTSADMTSAPELSSEDKIKSNELAPAATEKDPSMKDLVANAVAEAEQASEKAGVEYYGKDKTGILGNRLWYFDIGAVLDDTSEENVEVDPGFGISSGINFPLFKHLDLGGSLTYQRQTATVTYQTSVADVEYVRQTYRNYYYSYSYYRPRVVYRAVEVEEDLTLTNFAASGTLAFSLLPDKPINPFLMLGITYGNAKLENDSGGSISANGNGEAFGGGVEFKLDKKTSFIPAVFKTQADDLEETTYSALVSHWYAFRHAFRFGVAYGKEMENYSFSGGWMYSY